MKLYRYVLRRVLLSVPVLIGVTLIVFTLTRIAGDPVAAYVGEKASPAQIEMVREKYHLDGPMWEQYWFWMEGIVRGDWGYSRTAAMPVTDAIAYYLPATLELAAVSMLLSVPLGIWLGAKSAVKKDRGFDRVVRIGSVIGASLPTFLLGSVLLLIFYGQLQMFPYHGRVSDTFIIAGTLPQGPTGLYLFDSLWAGRLDLFVDVLWHLLLPVLTLSVATTALVLRVHRNSMLEVLNLDYVKMARAKGLSEKAVIRNHAQRNAMIPTVTMVGLAFGSLVGGTIVIESIFSWPGLGRWSVSSIQHMDTASVMGVCLVVACAYVIVNLIVDVAYAYLDPRVRLE